MRICNDRRSPMRHQQATEFFRTDIGGFNMNMTVNKSGGCKSPCAVNLFISLIFSDPRDCSIADCNISLYNFYQRKTLTTLQFFNDQIGGNSSGSNINSIFSIFSIDIFLHIFSTLFSISFFMSFSINSFYTPLLPLSDQIFLSFQFSFSFTIFLIPFYKMQPLSPQTPFRYSHSYHVQKHIADY